MTRAPMGVQVSLTQELYDVSDAIVRTRAIQAFDHAAKAYPIHRIVRCAVRRKAGPVFDDLALQMGCTAQRMGVDSLLLDGPGVFIGGEGYSKGEYISCTFRVWTDSLARFEEVRAAFAARDRRSAPARPDVRGRLEFLQLARQPASAHRSTKSRTISCSTRRIRHSASRSRSSSTAT